MSPGFLASMRRKKIKSLLKSACLCMIYTVLAEFSHERSDCIDFPVFLDGNRSPAAVCAPAQCCRGNFFCLISQQKHTGLYTGTLERLCCAQDFTSSKQRNYQGGKD